MLYATKVFLKSLEKEYAKTLHKFINDREVTQYITSLMPMTLAQELDWIESTAKSNTEIVFAICVYEEDDGEKVIGTVGLHNIDWVNRTATFGIVIGDKNYWSGGYGTEVIFLIIYWAFNSLNLLRINSAALAFNHRSIALHKKCGFMVEGKERNSIFKNGAHQDLVLFGLLKDEFIEIIYSM